MAIEPEVAPKGAEKQRKELPETSPDVIVAEGERISLTDLKKCVLKPQMRVPQNTTKH